MVPVRERPLGDCDGAVISIVIPGHVNRNPAASKCMSLGPRFRGDERHMGQKLNRPKLSEDRFGDRHAAWQIRRHAHIDIHRKDR